MQPDLEQLIPLVKRIAQEELLPYFACCQHEYKDDGSILTEADMACHHRLKQELALHWPEIGYLSEECPHKEQKLLLKNHSDALWVVDPLDGSNNFASGIPYFCLSLALVSSKGTRLSIVYDPNRDECFSAILGEGAWLNGERLQIDNESGKPAKPILISNIARLPERVRNHLISHPTYRTIRNFGASALEWCWLAAERGHLTVHNGQNFWDYAAGYLILSEAGGHSMSFDGDPVFDYSLKQRSVLAASNIKGLKQLSELFS
jgi:myo-inositol-1(or 4)-monophosphatase